VNGEKQMEELERSKFVEGKIGQHRPFHLHL
jgi:hypothetical protein